MSIKSEWVETDVDTVAAYDFDNGSEIYITAACPWCSENHSDLTIGAHECISCNKTFTLFLEPAKVGIYWGEDDA